MAERLGITKKTSLWKFNKGLKDPDLQIRGGGGGGWSKPRRRGGGGRGGPPKPGERVGGAVSKKFFSALQASVWSKNKGGPSPGSATDLYRQEKWMWQLVVEHQRTLSWFPWKGKDVIKRRGRHACLCTACLLFWLFFIKLHAWLESCHLKCCNVILKSAVRNMELP